MVKLNWKHKLAFVVLLSGGVFWSFSHFVHGGFRYQAKEQLECIGEGDSVDMDSKYSWLWNTCAINRGTDEKPKWVISKRDVGVEVDL